MMREQGKAVSMVASPESFAAYHRASQFGEAAHGVSSPPRQKAS